MPAGRSGYGRSLGAMVSLGRHEPKKMRGDGPGCNI